jgi:hypothetical protein
LLSVSRHALLRKQICEYIFARGIETRQEKRRKKCSIEIESQNKSERAREREKKNVEATISYIFEIHSSETKLIVLYIYLICEYSPIFASITSHNKAPKQKGSTTIYSKYLAIMR